MRDGRGGALAYSDNCIDAYIVFGPRSRPLNESDLLWRPFIHFLLGAYWTGTGLNEREFLDHNLALQAGGGVDLRRPTSIHDLRLSGNYRRVFVGEHGRHQLQLPVHVAAAWRSLPGTGRSTRA